MVTAKADEAHRSLTALPLVAKFGPVTVALCGLALLWQWGYLITGGVGFASPLQAGRSIFRLTTTTQFWVSLMETVVLSVGGLSLGLVAAILAGLLVGSSSFIATSSRGSINFLRAIPSVALIPLFIVSLGNSAWMVISLTALVSSFKLVVYVVRGVWDVAPTINEMTRVMRVSPVKRSLLVHLPAAAESIVMGLRLTVARAYGSVVVVGLTTSGPGIGGDMMRAKTAVNTPDLLAYAFIAGLIGTIFFLIFMSLEKKTLFWKFTS